MKKAFRKRICNWKEYNKSLIERGNLTIWFSEDTISSWLEKPSNRTKRGRPLTYSDDAILCALIIRAVFHLPLRSLQGFLISVVSLFGACIPIPHYSRICRRAASLGQSIKRLTKKCPVDLVFDSTGLKVYGEGEWKVRQHGIGKRRTWRKLHIAICPDTQDIVMEVLTENNVADCSVMQEMVPHIPESVKRVYGDGAYDTMLCRKALGIMEIKPLIPPQKNAVVHSGCSDLWEVCRNEAVETIMGLGNDCEARKLWKKLTGYHKRSLVETTMFRYKCLIGEKMRARKMSHQRAEVYASCLAINKKNSLGMPRRKWC